MPKLNREMHRGRWFDVGLGENNQLGYIHVVFWAGGTIKSRVGEDQMDEYEKLRENLLMRVADLVEGDPECQRIMEQAEGLKNCQPFQAAYPR